MMLHRHFEREKSKNVTTLKDVTPTPKKSEDEKPKKGGRPKKSDG